MKVDMRYKHPMLTLAILSTFAMLSCRAQEDLHSPDRRALLTSNSPTNMTSAAEHIFDTPEALGVIFHPRPDPRASDEKDIQISVEASVKLGARLHAKSKHAPLLLFFHGNGEIAFDYEDIAPMYNSMGLSVLVVDYRGYGKSEGSPTVATLLSDARSVFDQLPALLAEHDLAPSALYIMGRSLGSASAIEIASHAGNGIAALIIESGFAYPIQLVERLGGKIVGSATDKGTGELGALSKIAGVRVPTLIIHGQRDWIIPITDAQALHHHAGAEDKTLVTIPGAGHNDLLWRGQEQYFEAIRKLISPKE